MNWKLILGLFVVSFSMFVGFSHPVYAGESITCNANSHHVNPNELFTPCVCDPGYTQNGVGGNFNQPICIKIQVVGGMGIQIDSTALLLAGVQGSALWIIPAIVVAGSGIFFISFLKSKKKFD